MKSNICVIDYSVNDFVKMELISIAYNNNSSYFNEYVVFPLQVEAMRNRDTERNGLVGIRDRFLDFLDKRTCLELVHGNNKDNLPSGCNRNFSSNLLSINFDK
jgi:hypothetical protein